MDLNGRGEDDEQEKGEEEVEESHGVRCWTAAGWSGNCCDFERWGGIDV